MGRMVCNEENLAGKAKGTKGSRDLTVTDVNELGSSLFKLDIPATNGVLTVNHMDYEYDSFDVTVDADGKYTYTFHLKEELGEDYNNVDMQVGDEVHQDIFLPF